MKPTIVNVHDAKTQLSKLVARAEKGERITIARAGKAVAQLGPLTKAKRRRSLDRDPLLQVDEYSYDGPVDALTNRDIDAIVYGG
jgi:prevent-host-death family protein